MRYFVLFILLHSLCFNDTWSSPSQLSVTSKNTDDYYVGTDANGNALAVWHDTTDEIVYCAIFDGASWTRSEIATSIASADEIVLSVNGNGNAIVAWTNTTPSPDAIVAYYFNGSDWEGPEALSGDGKNVRVALSDDGTGFAIWELASDAGQIFAKRFNGTTWDADRTQVSNVETDADDPQVVMDSTGTACAAWREDRDDGLDQIQVRFFQNGSWGTITTISDTSIKSQFPSRWNDVPIAMSTDGKVLCGWETDNGEGIAYAYYNGSSWSTPTQLFSGTSDRPYATINSNGIGFIAFDDDDGIADGIKAANIVNGALQGISTIISSSDVRYPIVQIINSDGAICLYQRGTKEYAKLYNGSSWGAETSISGALDVSDEYTLFSLAPNGTGVAIYEQAGATGVLFGTVFSPSSLTTLPTNLEGFSQKGTIQFTWTPQSGVSQLQFYSSDQLQLLKTSSSFTGYTTVSAGENKATPTMVRSVSPFNQKSSFIEVESD